jgi:hypothetical protein
MNKKFLITESEKNDIRKMYGLIVEQEDKGCHWENWTNGDGISKPKIDVQKTTAGVTVTFKGPESGFCIQHKQGLKGDTIHQTAGVTRIEVGNYLKQLYNSGTYVYPDLDNIIMNKDNNYFSITVPLVKTTEDKSIMNFNERGSWGGNGEDILSEYLKTIQNKPEQYINIKVVQKVASGGNSSNITENWVSFRDIVNYPIKTKSQDSKEKTDNQSTDNQKITIEGNTFTEFKDNIKKNTKGISINEDSIEINIKTKTLTYSLGQTKIENLSLVWDNESGDNLSNRVKSSESSSDNSGLIRDAVDFGSFKDSEGTPFWWILSIWKNKNENINF